MKKLIIVSASIAVFYLSYFGPMEILACRLYDSMPGIIYLKASGILNYPHYKLAALSESYFKYYAKCYEIGCGEPFRYKYDSYKENFSLGISPTLMCHSSDFHMPPEPKGKGIRLPDPSWGSHDEFMKFQDTLIKGISKEEVLKILEGKPHKDNLATNSVICYWQEIYRFENLTANGDRLELNIFFDKENKLTHTSTSCAASAYGGMLR